MINAGISGNTTRDGLGRLQRDVLDQQPHLVTIMFGLNDMVRVPLAEYQVNLREIVTRCRAIGAEVLLCTPNGVIDSSDRPIAKLDEFCAGLRDVGRDLKVPVADCFAAYGELHQRDPHAWRMMLSDPIHPNMDGHKFAAIEIGRTITGRRAQLDHVGPHEVLLRHVCGKLAVGQKIKVVAMTPCDELLKAAFANAAPKASLEIVPWPAEGKSLAKMVEFATQVRGLKPDFVLVAVPAAATTTAGAPMGEEAIQGYSAILNAALSFGWQEWDVVGVAPRLLDANADTIQDGFGKRMVRAQDLALVDRPIGSVDPADAILARWLESALQPADAK